MKHIAEKTAAAAEVVRQRWDHTPKVGIILGTGLGGFAEDIDADETIPYGQIPHFPESTVVSHAGQLVCGSCSGVPVVAMEGRFHYYEGYSMQDITFPVRVMKELGAEILIVSNACGGLNPQYEAGDILVLDDHINLIGDNPLIGVNDDDLGPRFPDMCRPYDPELIAKALQVARENRITCHKGVYVAVAGPNLETRAEYRFLKVIGADVVGMSTVPECLVAVHGGMKVLGLSAITDMCLPDALQPVDIEEILATAAICGPKMRTVVRGVLADLA